MKKILFVDESGESNLNHVGRYFVLGTVLIDKKDFQFIQGYMRLVKRMFLKDELKNIHATDLVERPYMKYRRLVKPDDKVTGFIEYLYQIIRTSPIEVGLYYVDKDVMRRRLSYVPAPGRRSASINLNQPYKVASLEAIYNFSDYLVDNNCEGEIAIESRYLRDGDFVGYFDLARKENQPGGVVNPRAKEINSRINSLTISNKRVVDSGLELADLAAYSAYRKLVGDPMRRLKVPIERVLTFFNLFKRKSYLINPSGRRTGIRRVS